MLNPEISKIVAFTSSKDLNEWLQRNHKTKSELWVKIFKKGSGTQSVTWNDVVIESLCWGWIDGIKKSLDEQAYLHELRQEKFVVIGQKETQSMLSV